MDMQNDFHRLFFFEDARKTAEAIYIKNPLDAGNLTNWGEALLELSQFQNFHDLMSMIRDAISKLDEALVVNPNKHIYSGSPLGERLIQFGSLSEPRMHYGWPESHQDCPEKITDEQSEGLN
ncbi:hypothetical protein QQ045_023735 [Rhodiola kirilowii]